jgi:ribosomal protein L24E
MLLIDFARKKESKMNHNSRLPRKIKVTSNTNNKKPHIPSGVGDGRCG